MNDYFGSRDLSLYQEDSCYVNKNPFAFVNVINEIDPQELVPSDFSKIKDEVNDLPFAGILQRYFSKADLCGNRGNRQVNFGWSGGQSHQTRSDGQIRRDVGTAIPSERDGTRDDFVVNLFVMMTKVAKRVQIPWSHAEYLVEHPEVADRLEKFSKTLHRGNIFEHMTIAFMVLDGHSCINRHVDTENCDELSHTLTVSRCMRCPFDTKL